MKMLEAPDEDPVEVGIDPPNLRIAHIYRPMGLVTVILHRYPETSLQQ
jgi:hypothetical protein